MITSNISGIIFNNSTSNSPASAKESRQLLFACSFFF